MTSPSPSPSPSKMMPPQCQLRSLITRIGGIEHAINKSLTACAAWAQEADYTSIRKECSLLRIQISQDLRSINVSLADAIKNISRIHERNRDLVAQASTLEAKIKDFENEIKVLEGEEMSFSQAMSELESSQGQENIADQI